MCFKVKNLLKKKQPKNKLKKNCKDNEKKKATTKAQEVIYL